MPKVSERKAPGAAAPLLAATRRADEVTSDNADSALQTPKKRPISLTLNTFPASTTAIASTLNEGSRRQAQQQETVNAQLTKNDAPSGSQRVGQQHQHQHSPIGSVDIEFENVRYTKKVGFLKRELKHIMAGLSGCFRAGELTAIIGPSGAGKSTLLNILSGYIIKGYSGNFYANGDVRDLKILKPNIVYIRQDTSLQDFLSVEEAMNFAINLKVSGHLSNDAKEQRIRAILEAMNLYKIRNTLTKVLSGGEKKRLTIALELVNNAPVLILDEPTTGLDSSATGQLIQLLRGLAEEGRTVICTMHQPSSLVLSWCHHLYAVAEGQCLYAGAPENLVGFLDQLQLTCPKTYNPADYLMEIATHDYGNKLNDKLIALIENGRNKDFRVAHISSYANANDELSALKKAGLREAVPLHKTTNLQNQAVGCSFEAHSVHPASFCRQLSVLLTRTFLLIWRDSSLTTLRFSIHLIIGLLIGILYYNIGNDADNALNNFRLYFYSIMFVMYSAFSGILVKFPLEFPIVSREHFNSWYSLLAYYLAITIADLPLQIICTSLFIIPTYLMSGQPTEIMRFSLYFLIIFLTALVAQSIGLAVGSSFSVQLGAIFGPFFICPFLQFSGFFLQEKDAPVYLRWVFDISFLRYSLDGAMLAMFGYEREKLHCGEIYCHYVQPQYMLKDLDLQRANYERAAIFLLGLLLLLRIVAFYVMSFRLKFFR